MLSIDDVLAYDPETGFLTWKVDRRSVRAGARAGGVDLRRGEPRRRLAVNGKHEFEHRVAWYLMTGKWPKAVDHINGDATDNRWPNLRECTGSQNQANRKVSENSATGLKGVSWDGRTKKWKAAITKDDKFVWLGRFDCPAAAHFAYVVAADKMFGEFACNGRRA